MGQARKHLQGNQQRKASDAKAGAQQLEESSGGFELRHRLSELHEHMILLP